MDGSPGLDRRPVRINPAVLAWALGYGVFLAFVGGALVSPADPFTQLFVAAGLLVLVVPVVYLVLDADDVARHDVKSRRPLPYLVGTTLASTVVVSLVPVPFSGTGAILVRTGAFLAVFAVASWLAIRLGRDDDPDPPVRL